MGKVQVFSGDCIKVMQALQDNSIDAVVTDPPYGLEFMGKEWDSFEVKPRRVKGTGGNNAPFANHAVTLDATRGKAFQAWCEEWATECLRVLKPGGHLLAFGGTRTYHRLAAGIEDAGFEIRDSLHWIYGSGFPKSHNISKALDTRRVDHAVGFKRMLADAVTASGKSRQQINAECGFTMRFDVPYEKDPGCWGSSLPSPEQFDVICKVLGIKHDYQRDEYRAALVTTYEVVGHEDRLNSPSGIVSAGRASTPVRRELTAPGTSDAARWEGWGTALKPAHEPIVLARKPLAGTVAANVLTHGTGGLNIDATRIPTADRWEASGRQSGTGNSLAGSVDGSLNVSVSSTHEGGRWPANILLTHAPDCQPAGTRLIRSNSPSVPQPKLGVKAEGQGVYRFGTGEGRNGTVSAGYADADGMETVEAWDCAPGCPVAELDRQSGTLTSSAWDGKRNKTKTTDTYGAFEGQPEKPREASSGGASRFFPCFRYQAKAPSSQRPKEDDISHPTVKPLDLMRWLVRLVTPPDGVVLDPFAGSGTTGEACLEEGFRCVLVEREPGYLRLIRKRLDSRVPTLWD